MAQVLKNLVERRFADLPDWAVDGIDRADVAMLERWSYRVLDATALEDVFRADDPADKAGVESPAQDLPSQLMLRSLEIGESGTISLKDLAQSLWDMNRLSKAEPLMRRALEIDESVLGGEHPDVAVHLNNLALLRTSQYRDGSKEPRAFAARPGRSPGPQNPNGVS